MATNEIFDLVYEILSALGAVACIGSLVFSLWQDYKRQRMEREEKERSGGHRSF